MGQIPITPINNKFRLPTPNANAGDTAREIRIITKKNEGDNVIVFI